MSKIIIDTEVYENYFLFRAKKLSEEKWVNIEVHNQGAAVPLTDDQKKKLTRLMGGSTTISFNGNNYDLYIIAAALSGYSCAKLKHLSDELINSNAPGWVVARDNNVSLPHNWDHIDLFEVTPGRSSLKIYGGRLGWRRLQELPLDPTSIIKFEHLEMMRDYCGNDIRVTEQLYFAVEPAIKLREEMGARRGGIDLRSKSDAQIAETVIKRELTLLTGKSYKPQEIEVGTTLPYRDPGIVSFKSRPLKVMYAKILRGGFPVGTNGAVQLPKWLRDTKIAIGGSTYQMGIGGLHSCEKSRSITPGPDQFLADFDVASYYPSIILKLKLSPGGMGDGFLRVYQQIVTDRLKAKAQGDKLTADTLKIVVNGSFGKLGSKWSALYAPQLMIQTTITGQLCLLMLIERIEAAGCQVVSANTDGVVVLGDKDKEDELSDVLFDWMLDTSFELERSDYRSLHSRDVNNYIAVKPDGEVKRKGVYATGGLAKNPDFKIVADAVALYLSTGTPMERTIRECMDITSFVHLRTVQGGAVWRDDFQGKAIRFYYSTEVGADEQISYAKNSNKVPRSDGARPLQDIPAEFPDDVDYDRYVKLAHEALEDMGAAS